jgi:anti-sigma regulatory factor (Ser/Thr protein kinase)
MLIDPHRQEARIELTVDNDPRLMRGVANLVSQAGRCAGLPRDAQNSLGEAVAEACRQTFPLLNGSEAALKLIVEHFHDRVEVTIEHSGEPIPTAGLDTFCADAESARSGSVGLSAALLSTHIDRVRYETRDGRSRTTLIKYCPGGAPEVS